MKRGWGIFLFFALFAIDFVSKRGALSSIPPLSSGIYPFGGTAVFENFLGISFSLNQIANTGAAWGLFQGHPLFLFLFRLFVIGVFLFYLLRREKSPWFIWIILAGACGNALDYLLYGHVIDFFHFVFWGYSFPIFNLADAFLSIGSVFFLFSKKRPVCS